MTRCLVVLLLLVVVGSAAFELQELFGRPRTRARALAYAKRAVLNTQQNVAKKDEATLTTAKERGSLRVVLLTAARRSQLGVS